MPWLTLESRRAPSDCPALMHGHRPQFPRQVLRSLPPTGTATHPGACDGGFAAVATSSASAHSNFAITGLLNTPLASSFCPVPNRPLQEPYPGPHAWTGKLRRCRRPKGSGGAVTSRERF